MEQSGIQTNKKSSARPLSKTKYRPKAHPIGAHSRPHSLAKLDGRRKEAWLMRRVREELTEHVGGHPTITQRLLIERAAVLILRLAKIDQKIVDDRPFTLIDNNSTIAWQNALTRCLVALGVHQDAARAGSSLGSVLQELDADADEEAAA